MQVIRGNSEALRFCLDVEKDLRARRDGVLPQQEQLQPQQQRPTALSAKPGHFKFPSNMKDLFPAWASAGRSKPLNLRRWFLGAERVCRSYYLDEHDWGRAVALDRPSGRSSPRVALALYRARSQGCHMDGPRGGFRGCFSAAVQPRPPRGRVGCPTASKVRTLLLCTIIMQSLLSYVMLCRQISHPHLLCEKFYVTSTH